MNLDDWLEAARQDANRRGLGELRSMLDTLVQATRALRAADWNDDPSGRTGKSASPHPTPRSP
jgi:hypothetical protein